MAFSIRAGENLLVRVDLIQKDLTPLVISTGVDSIQVEIMQNGNVIETLTYPSANLRDGETTSQFEVEIIQATSALFTKGDVTMRTTIVADDTDFDTEEVQKVIDVRLIANVK